MFKGHGQTFKPKRKIAKGSKQYELHKQAKATLHAGNLKKAVELPQGESLCEWVACNTIDFFNQVNLLFGSVSDFCTAQSCPTMGAGPNYEYLWQGAPEYPKPTAVPAQKYVELLMTWIQGQLDDPALFPGDLRGCGDQGPTKEFWPELRKMYKRLFRVYAHLYHSHLARMSQLGIEPHLNTSFKHFALFCREYRLIEDKRELAPLQQLVQSIYEDYGLK